MPFTRRTSTVSWYDYAAECPFALTRASFRLPKEFSMSMRASLVAFFALVLACAVPSAAWAAAPTVSNQDLALSATVTVPLTIGGSDSVPLAGVIHASTW